MAASTKSCCHRYQKVSNKYNLGSVAVNFKIKVQLQALTELDKKKNVIPRELVIDDMDLLAGHY